MKGCRTYTCQHTHTHILHISCVPLGLALGRNNTHNTVLVFLPPGALIGGGVADSPARLRMSSLNHDVYHGLLVLIKVSMLTQLCPF